MTFGALLSPRLLVVMVAAMLVAAVIVPIVLAWGPAQMPLFCPPHC